MIYIAKSGESCYYLGSRALGEILCGDLFMYVLSINTKLNCYHMDDYETDRHLGSYKAPTTIGIESVNYADSTGLLLITTISRLKDGSIVRNEDERLDFGSVLRDLSKTEMKDFYFHDFSKENICIEK